MSRRAGLDTMHRVALAAAIVVAAVTSVHGWLGILAFVTTVRIIAVPAVAY
jgi:hypothetical protein